MWVLLFFFYCTLFVTFAIVPMHRGPIFGNLHESYTLTSQLVRSSGIYPLAVLVVRAKDEKRRLVEAMKRRRTR